MVSEMKSTVDEATGRFSMTEKKASNPEIQQQKLSKMKLKKKNE